MTRPSRFRHRHRPACSALLATPSRRLTFILDPDVYPLDTAFVTSYSVKQREAEVCEVGAAEEMRLRDNGEHGLSQD